MPHFSHWHAWSPAETNGPGFRVQIINFTWQYCAILDVYKHSYKASFWHARYLKTLHFLTLSKKYREKGERNQFIKYTKILKKSLTECPAVSRHHLPNCPSKPSCHSTHGFLLLGTALVLCMHHVSNCGKALGVLLMKRENGFLMNVFNYS